MYTRKPCCGTETALRRCKIQYVGLSKFTAASHGSPCSCKKSLNQTLVAHQAGGADDVCGTVEHVCWHCVRLTPVTCHITRDCPPRPTEQTSSSSSSNQSILFLTWPKQQTATSKLKDHRGEEQLKGKTGV